ncbi:MAG: hypothetical protein PVI92_00865 [Chromatiales bacterium]|jgi:hypothetical protein
MKAVNSLKNKMRHTQAALMAGLTLLAMNAHALSVGEIGENVGEQASGIASGAKLIFLALGFVLVGWGVFKLAMRKPNDPEPASSAWKLLGFGALLTVIGFIINAITGSIGAGEGAGELSNIGL